MAPYKGKSKKYKRKVRKAVRRWRKGKYFPKCINATSRSRATIKVTSQWRGQTAIVANSEWSQPIIFHPLVDCTSTGTQADGYKQFWLGNSILGVTQFIAMRQLYAQYKINYCKVKLSFGDDAAFSRANVLGSSLYCAIDRQCKLPDLSEPGYLDQTEIMKTASVPYIFNSSDYMTYQKKCWPSDLFEKASWFESDMHAKAIYPPGGPTGYTLTVQFPHALDGENITQFAPGFFFAFRLPNSISADTRYIYFTLTCTCYITFRNPKNTLVISSGSKITPKEVETLPDMDDDELVRSTQLLDEDEVEVIKIPKKKSKILGADDSSKIKAKATAKTDAPKKS